MKLLKTLFTLTILISTYHFSLAQVVDSTQTTVDQTNNVDTISVDDDFSPGLFFAVIIVFAIGLMCVGAGIAITIIGLLILFGLIGAGILSTSILVGIYNKSFAKGFKIFLVSLTTLSGLIVGTLGVWGLNEIFNWLTTQTALITGSVSGLVSGFLLGISMFYVIQKVIGILKEKFKTKNNDTLDISSDL